MKAVLYVENEDFIDIVKDDINFPEILILTKKGKVFINRKLYVQKGHFFPIDGNNVKGIMFRGEMDRFDSDYIELRIKGDL